MIYHQKIIFYIKCHFTLLCNAVYYVLLLHGHTFMTWVFKNHIILFHSSNCQHPKIPSVNNNNWVWKHMAPTKLQKTNLFQSPQKEACLLLLLLAVKVNYL